MSDDLAFVPVRWPAPPAVCAAFTTRMGGVSAPPWDSLNLATHVGDDARAVAENRRRLARALALPASPCWLTQVHGDRVVRVDAGPLADPRADASVTDRPGCVLAVQVADCLPLLLCDREGREVAAVHAGWRGLAAGIIGRAVRAFRAPARALLAWTGPAIGARAYAVGADLRTRFVAAAPASASAFTRHDGEWHMDLAALARQQLHAAGVAAVSAADHCVWTEPERFFSYRRDGVTGRMAALIWIR
jgi:YfiH family protein